MQNVIQNGQTAAPQKLWLVLWKWRYANYKEKGFCPEAAQAMAVESLEMGEDPKESLRFARIHG